MKAEFYLELNFDSASDYKEFASKLSTGSNEVNDLIVKSVLGRKLSEPKPEEKIVQKPENNLGSVEAIKPYLVDILENIKFLDERVTEIAKDKYTNNNDDVINMLKVIDRNMKNISISPKEKEVVKPKPKSSTELSIDMSQEEIEKLKNQTKKEKFKPKRGRGLATGNSSNI